jgi:hypothetical protein
MIDRTILLIKGFEMRKSLSAVLLCAVIFLSAVPARPQAALEATVEPETRARIVLQSQLNSKLNEPGDPVSAVLDEPLYVNDALVLPRGTEFHGRVTEATAAGRGQKNGTIAVIFEQIRMAWGEVPVAITITAIDDWANNEKMKADEEGGVKGSRSGKRTAENVERGGTIGAAGGLATVLLGGGGAAAGGAIAGGLLGGLLLMKGGDVRVAPGAVFRIKFVKPLTLPVVDQMNRTPRPIQQGLDSQGATKKPENSK